MKVFANGGEGEAVHETHEGTDVGELDGGDKGGRWQYLR